ncbi:hypothetical protein CL89_gp100 [Aeromonas phage PX29]|uniref:Uncharacterized protein n=1 Tax=Aeromonas phage PX29 TaxID=926067 RepID=E5DQ33_9CAUD|nr:hypothetical protein CL89_gp100 [Aeromonas phage PX29]ADQ52819.1 conserved hypothetical protein [Aeromonas phage PX29]
MRLKTEMDAKLFKKFTGRKPIQDDLERVNCQQAGKMGHTHCGWNHRAHRPMYEDSHENLFVDLQRHCGAFDYHGKWKYNFNTMFPLDAVMHSIEEVRKYAAVAKRESFDFYAYSLTKARGIEGEFVVATAEFTIVADGDWEAKEKFDKIVDILVKADKLDLYSKLCIEKDLVVQLSQEALQTFKFI